MGPTLRASGWCHSLIRSARRCLTPGTKDVAIDRLWGSDFAADAPSCEALENARSMLTEEPPLTQGGPSWSERLLGAEDLVIGRGRTDAADEVDDAVVGGYPATGFVADRVERSDVHGLAEAGDERGARCHPDVTSAGTARSCRREVDGELIRRHHRVVEGAIIEVRPCDARWRGPVACGARRAPQLVAGAPVRQEVDRSVIWEHVRSGVGRGRVEL